jgi:hypothetical protein
MREGVHTRTFNITANGLKWIAIVAMVIDHVAWKAALPVPALFVMHLFGRMTMPIMCFLIAEGFRHTGSRKRYALRLLAFGLVAQPAFNYYWSGDPFAMEFGLGAEMGNVLFGLLFGLCALWAVKSAISVPAKIALLVLCLAGASMCDWSVFGVLWILAFGLNSGSFRRQAMWYSVVSAITVATIIALGGNAFSLMNFGVFLVLPLLSIYNGKKSGASTPAWLTNKWLFYAFYPAHLLLIGFLCFGLGWLR